MPDALPDHERIRSARVVEVGYIAHPRSHQRNAGPCQDLQKFDERERDLVVMSGSTGGEEFCKSSDMSRTSDLDQTRLPTGLLTKTRVGARTTATEEFP